MNPAEIRTFYRVQSMDPASPEEMWSWLPITDTNLRVELTNGFSGWEVELTKGSDGLTGTARALSDVLPIRGEPVRARFVAVPCS